MLDWIIGILAFVVVLSLIIIIHEGGHFFFAKKAGILCYEFALGMGPVIYQKRRGETVYSIRAIPLGGYVAMAGEEVEADYLKDVKKVKLELTDGVVTKIIANVDSKKYEHLDEYNLIEYDLIGSKEAKEDELFVKVESINEDHMNQNEVFTYVVKRDAIVSFTEKQELQIAPYDRTFVNKPLKNRFLSVVAGPLMNFVLAFFVFLVMGLIGGYAAEDTTIISDVTENTPAYVAGLKKDDQIIQIGEFDNLTEWSDISNALASYATGSQAYDGTLVIKYVRDGVEQTTSVTPQTIVYAMEMVLANVEGKETLPIVGSYADSETNKKTIAYKAGLREGDIIKSIKVKDTGIVTVISSKNDLLKFFNEYERANISGEDLEITISRNSQDETIEVETYSTELLSSQGIEITKVQLGISPIYKFNLLKLLYMPFVQIKDASLLVVNTLKLLFTDKTVNLNDLSGPIGILSLIKDATSQGLLTLLNWTAIISVNVGLMNLLPIPALDGGRIAFLIYEAITKKKPSPKVENTIHNIGFILLMVLFVYVAFNDVIRLIFR